MPPVHDYVIDNSTGANVRSDLNSVLQAILTNNSSSSAPTTTAAYMWWADTTTGILKIRNSANDGWVELLQLDGTLTLEDGTATNPALAFRDDLNTGIFSSAADTFNVATGGVERMELGTTTIFNESGADVDFRIESSGSDSMFYLNAGSNAIGLNRNDPKEMFEVGGNIYLTFNTSNAGEGGALKFQSKTGGFNTSYGAAIYGLRVGDTSSYLRFDTGGQSEKMRLDENGRLGIGLSNPTKILHVTGTSSPEILLQPSDASPALFMGDSNRTGDGQHLAEFGARWNGTRVARIVMQAGDDTTNKDNGQMVFMTASAGTPQERVRINEQGDIGINENVPAARLHVNGGNGLLVERSAGTSIAGFKHSGSNIQNVYFQNTGSTNHPSVGSEDQDLTIGTNNSNRIKVSSVGDTIILAVNVYEGGRSMDINSTSPVTFFTFSNSQANAFVARFTATENNNTTGYIVTGSVVGNQINQSFMHETNHAHSKDVLFSLAGTGNTQLQIRASQFTTTRRVRLIDIFVNAGRPTYA